jgi:tetratricopeptide (TPR) repeat protein
MRLSDWALVALTLLPASGVAGVKEDLEQGYDHFYNLEYPEAIAAFEKAAADDPTSPLAQNGIAQSVLYREMFRNGALESELIDGTNSFLRRPKLEPSQDTETRFFAAINKSLELSQRELDKNPRDTMALHARAVAFAFRCNWNFLVRKAWRDSLRDATASRKLEDQVLAINPKDPDAPLGRGVHEYIIGGLPWTWRTLGFLVGFHGDKAKGLATVEQVAKNGTINKPDAEIMLCAFYRRDRNSKKALPLLADLVRRYPRNFLLRFEQAKMYADIGDGKNALAKIDEIEQLKQSNAPGYVRVPAVKIYFERATVQFWYNFPRESMDNFKKVVAAPEDLDLNAGVLSYMRIGQILDMQNQHQQAIEFYRKAISFAPEAEAAQESRHYISSPYRRS